MAAMQQRFVAWLICHFARRGCPPISFFFFFFTSGHSFVTNSFTWNGLYPHYRDTDTMKVYEMYILHKERAREEEHSLLESYNQSGFILWNLMHITHTLSHNNQVREIPSVCFFFLFFKSSIRMPFTYFISSNSSLFLLRVLRAVFNSHIALIHFEIWDWICFSVNCVP